MYVLQLWSLERQMPRVVVTLEGEVVKPSLVVGHLSEAEAARKIQRFFLKHFRKKKYGSKVKLVKRVCLINSKCQIVCSLPFLYHWVVCLTLFIFCIYQ